jgi:hypothetical protein
MPFKIIKVFLINILVFFTLILIIELFIFTFLNKTNLDCAYLLCGKKFEYKIINFDNNKNYKVVYKRDKYGFRDRHKELENIDVLVLGGSTTDERWLKDEDTWINQLEEKLKIYHKKDIDIVNSGIDGQSTFGHIWNFNNWYNKLNSFSPKYLIFYIGINDQLYLSPEEIKKKRKNYDNPRDSSNLNLFMKIKNILRKNNGIVYRGYILLRDLISKNKDYFEVGHSPKREKMNYKIPSKKFLININSKKNFLDNLNMLYKYTIEIDAIPIFITQKTMRGNKISNKIVSISEFDYFSYEKKISNMIIDYCNDKEILCINVNELLDLTTNDTYDRVHLVPSGSKKLSVLLFDKLKYELKF